MWGKPFSFVPKEKGFPHTPFPKEKRFGGCVLTKCFNF